MNSEYYDFADSLADNSNAIKLSQTVCQDLRRYNRRIFDEEVG